MPSVPPSGYSYAACVLVRATQQSPLLGGPGPADVTAAGGTYGNTVRVTLDGTTSPTAATVYGQVSSTDGSGIYGGDAVCYPSGYPRDLALFWQGTQIHCYTTHFTSGYVVVEWKLQQNIPTLEPDLYVLAWGNGAPTVLRDLARVYVYADNFDTGTLDAGWSAQNCTATLHPGYVTLDGSGDPAGLARTILPDPGGGLSPAIPNSWLDISADVRLPSVQQENWPDLVRIGLGIRRGWGGFSGPVSAFNDFLIHTHDYQTDVHADGATVYWRLDDTGATAVDATPNGHNGAITGGVTHSVTSPLFEQPNPGMTFSGGQVTESGAGHTNNSGPFPGSTPFTLECWFKTTTTQGGLLMGFGTSSTPGVASAETDKVLYMGDDGQVHFVTAFADVWSTAAPLNDGAWHYAVATVGNPYGTRLYIDGIAVMISTLAFSSLTTMWLHVGDDPGLPNVGWVGGLPDAPTSTAFAGSIDEAAVYVGNAGTTGGQLSPAQVATHYYDGTHQPQPQAFLEDLVLWHPLSTAPYTGFTGTGWGGWAPAGQWVSMRAHFGWAFGGWTGKVWDTATPEPTSWLHKSDYFHGVLSVPAVRLTCPSRTGYPVDFRYARVRLGPTSDPSVTVAPPVLGYTGSATQGARTVRVAEHGDGTFPSLVHVPFHSYEVNAGARPAPAPYALVASDPLGRALWKSDGQSFLIYRQGTVLATYGQET